MSRPAAEEQPLPDYERPPVIEAILGVQFDSLPGFRNAHLGAFWKTLDTDEWPAVFDAPALQPQFERFAEEDRWAKGVQLHLSKVQPTRLQIKNKVGDRMIQVQSDRFHFNWLGQTGGHYPRYEQVREGFVHALRQFLDFVATEKLGDFHSNQWEITYLNDIPKGSVWHTPSDWGFFRPLGPVPTIDGLIEGEGFGGEWHFLIPHRRGRLHVQWQHALRVAQEESQQQKQEIVRLTFTARGPVAIEEHDDQLQAVLEGLDLGRKTIVCSFERLMSEAANQFWGLKHASD